MVDKLTRTIQIMVTLALIGVSGSLTAGCAIDATTSVASDRSMSQVVTDAEIVLDINKRLLASENQDLFFDVTTNVYEAAQRF